MYSLTMTLFAACTIVKPLSPTGDRRSDLNLRCSIGAGAAVGEVNER